MQGAALFDGDNVVGVNGWRFVHGPAIDDPLVGLGNLGGTWLKYFYLTDGAGRLLAFADSLGRGLVDDVTYYQNGANQAGAIDKSTNYSNSRAEAPQAAGLSFYRNRYYDQNTGRWTQEDPVGIAGGVNLYAYVGNNPATYTDPFGLCNDASDPPDSIRVPVPVRCPNGTTETQWIWAHRVTDPGTVSNTGRTVEKLSGGRADYPAAEVKNNLITVLVQGAVYSFAPTTPDGGVVQFGMFSGELPDHSGYLLGIGDADVTLLRNGSPSAYTCQSLGHEGVHITSYAKGLTRPGAPGNDAPTSPAWTIIWRCGR
jgi:RHS repeat-associated protein